MRFTDDTFDPDQGATIGVDFKVKTLNLDGKRVKLSIWVSCDTSVGHTIRGREGGGGDSRGTQRRGQEGSRG